MLIVLTATACTSKEPPPAAPPPALQPAPNPPSPPSLKKKDVTVDPLPKDPHLADAVKKGALLFNDTRTHASKYVGNNLVCANCHRDGGQNPRALPLVGISAIFPKWAPRNGRIFNLYDRVKSCFERSLNGTGPAYDSEEYLALSAYLGWISEGQPYGQLPPGYRANNIPQAKLQPMEKLDLVAGEKVFKSRCARCHGENGQGLGEGETALMPLWGPRSYNDGAMLGQVYALAHFVRNAMPCDVVPGDALAERGVKQEGAPPLTDEEAQNVAAFVNSQDRPVWRNKNADWPGSTPAKDAVYYFPENPLKARRLKSLP